MGNAAAFSFYPGKNLGACGEGGAVTTNDDEIARQVRMLRDHGQSRKYIHDVEGYNGRLDAVQAGILQVKLRRLTKWNQQRRGAAARYRGLFEAAAVEKVILPFEPSWARSVYHLYGVRVSKRDALIRHLAGAGIGSGIHYPIPLHLQKAYESLGYATGDFPIAEELVSEIDFAPDVSQYHRRTTETCCWRNHELYPCGQNTGRAKGVCRLAECTRPTPVESKENHGEQCKTARHES